MMNEQTRPRVAVVGGGLAGSEAAYQLASRGIAVRLYEMRPEQPTPVHHSDQLAELVCSNSLKSMKEDSAAGLLKQELHQLGSKLYEIALKHQVAAGGALAVDREKFAAEVTALLEAHPLITIERKEITSLQEASRDVDAVILASGPLTSDSLAQSLQEALGQANLAFYDAAAPIVMADSLDQDILFRQSRYEDAEAGGDYLNAPFTKEEYEYFIDELLQAERVVAKDFETRDLFQACQPVEEIARTGRDAPRFGTMKPVGLTDPRTGKRPWAALQLRAENAEGTCYNLVGFQTNLTFPEQKRVFSLIPGLEHAEFARYGVMHRNTFLDAPRCIDAQGCLFTAEQSPCGVPVYVAGQLAGTEGYSEAIRSGLHCAFSVWAWLQDVELPALPPETVFGALMNYASDPEVKDYQPMHVNFGLIPPLETPVKNKRARYEAYSQRAREALDSYRDQLAAHGVWDGWCED